MEEEVEDTQQSSIDNYTGVSIKVRGRCPSFVQILMGYVGFLQL
jgi:hypothetical protein